MSPLYGLFTLLDVHKQNKLEKDLRELLSEKGLPEDIIKSFVSATGYQWLDDSDKRKFQKRTGKSEEEMDAFINNAYFGMLQFEDVAYLLIKNKKKAKEAHIQAREEMRKIQAEKQSKTLSPLSNEIEKTLLAVGNETIKILKSHDQTQKSAPKGSWEVSYTVEKSSLTYSILLNYDIFMRNFAGAMADPPLWITFVALFSSSPLRKYASSLPQDLRIYFMVNGDGEEAMDWKASCSIKELLNAETRSIGKSLEEAAVIMMTVMELDN